MATSKTASCFQLGVRFPDGSLLRNGLGVATLTLPSTSNYLTGQLAGDGTLFDTTLIVASSAGTITLPTPKNQSANTIFAGPATGPASTPTFRALVTGDIPSPAFSFVSKSGSYPLTANDYAVQFTATATATLPSGMVTGKIFRIKLTGSASTLTISPASGTIDGAASYVTSTQYQAIDVMFDGANWFIF